MKSLNEARRALLDAGFAGVERCGFVLVDPDSEDLALSMDTKIKPGIWGYYRHYPKPKIWQGMFLLRPAVDPEVEDAQIALRIIEKSTAKGLYTVTFEDTHSNPEVADLDNGRVNNLTLSGAIALIIKVCVRVNLLN